MVRMSVTFQTILIGTPRRGAGLPKAFDKKDPRRSDKSAERWSEGPNEGARAAGTIKIAGLFYFSFEI